MKKIFAVFIFLVFNILSFSEFGLDEYEDNVFSGGPSKDGIPSIDKPRYETVEKSEKFMENRDSVFVVKLDGEVKIFPQKILVWHEIVNDVIAGKNVSITYCPLTGTAIGYFRKDSTLGVSGKLVNSNLIMYDRKTDSYFPQILGRAINGPRKGEELESFNIYWSTWKKAKEEFSFAEVLSLKTGYIRNYRKDPYGDYFDPKGYYKKGGSLFPLMAIDERYGAKELVVGIKAGDARLAVLKSMLMKEKVLNVDGVLVLYNERLNTPKVFSSSYLGKTIKFEWKNNGIYDASGEEWSIEDMQGKLVEVPAFEAFWFAWSSFFPDTKVYE
jgi:hypothetical protein